MNTPERILKLAGGTFWLSVDQHSGSIVSNLHYATLDEFLAAAGEVSGDPLDDQFRYGRYEGAIDAFESLLLSAAQAGMDVESAPFRTALQTTLDALGGQL